EAEADARAEAAATDGEEPLHEPEPAGEYEHAAARSHDDPEDVAHEVPAGDELPAATEPAMHPTEETSGEGNGEAHAEGASEGHGEEIASEPAEAPETVNSGHVEQVGSEDAMEEVPEPPRRRMRSYKIQEVIKRRQIILVQVVKEERGSKGAALTT